MLTEIEITNKLIRQRAAFVRFVDVSEFSPEQNRGLNTAILFGLTLSPEFITEVASNENYVRELVLANRQDEDEFSQKELEVGRMADELTKFLQDQGYRAWSQSDKNQEENGYYDSENHTTPLPHKTIAVKAGLGWIGKHDLLITREWGSAISMCAVLTNAPIQVVNTPEMPSRCGNCAICKEVCETGAISGKSWMKGIGRNELVDVQKCTTCLKCLVHCPWTKGYAKNL
jgi:epoxyqueuosine reductase QueG